MKINNLRDFLQKVFELYSEKKENNAVMEIYFELLYKPTIKYNFDDAIREIFENYRYKTVPTGAYLAEVLDRHKIIDKFSELTNGTIVAVQKCNTGKEYVFQFAFGGACPSLEETRRYLAKRGLVIRKIERYDDEK